MLRLTNDSKLKWFPIPRGDRPSFGCHAIDHNVCEWMNGGGRADVAWQGDQRISDLQLVTQIGFDHKMLFGMNDLLCIGNGRKR